MEWKVQIEIKKGRVEESLWRKKDIMPLGE